MCQAYNNAFAGPVCVWLYDNSRRHHKAVYVVGITTAVTK